ncbi:MAG: hypothetical protein HY319_10340 [Armatimonadetes bacterium]|nr:hypothetical protein [Armatimonadota bacterium]
MGRLEVLSKLGYRFLAGRTAAAGREQPIPQVLDLLLRNPPELRSKLWICRTELEPDPVESVRDLKRADLLPP